MTIVKAEVVREHARGTNDTGSPEVQGAWLTARINELSPEESDATLKMLYAHVMQPKYAYTHHWSVGDVLLWDHLGTWHCALADYAPNEYRLMKRCQVMADKVFDPAFLQEKLRVVA